METNVLQDFPHLFIFDQLRVIDQIIAIAGSDENPNEAVIDSLSLSLQKASHGGRIELSKRLPDWLKEKQLIFEHLPGIERKLIYLERLLSKLESDKDTLNRQASLTLIAEIISNSEKSEYLLLFERIPQWIQECDEVFPLLRLEHKIQILCADLIKTQKITFQQLPEIERKLVYLKLLMAKLESDEEISNRVANLNLIVELISSSTKTEYLLLIERTPQWIQECDEVFYFLRIEEKIQILCHWLATSGKTNSQSIIPKLVKVLSKASENECQQLITKLPYWIKEEEEIIDFLLPEEKILLLIKKLSNCSDNEDCNYLITQIAETLSKISTKKHCHLLNQLPSWTKEKSEIFCFLSPSEKIGTLSRKSTEDVDENEFIAKQIAEILDELNLGERNLLLQNLPDCILLCNSIFILLSFDRRLEFLLERISIENQNRFKAIHLKEIILLATANNSEVRKFGRNQLQEWLASNISKLVSEYESELVELQRLEQEQLAIKELQELKKKYLADSYKEESPLSYFHLMLINLDENKSLNERDIEFLKINKLYGTLAMYYQKRFNKTHEPWDLIKASGYWRDNLQPNTSIEITEYLFGAYDLVNSRIKAAALTTRGGAFRDLRNLEAAEDCANSAIQIDPKNYYPYNLLGAIYFERGDGERGKGYFDKALELGAPQGSQEKQMMGALMNTGKSERQAVAKYLLQRDPVKYRWANYYL